MSTVKFSSIDPTRPINGLTFDGQEYQADAAGIIEAPAEAMEQALAHGLAPVVSGPVNNQPPATLEQALKALPNKPAVVAYALEHYALTLDETLKRGELEAAVLQAEAAKLAAEAQNAANEPE